MMVKGVVLSLLLIAVWPCRSIFIPKRLYTPWKEIPFDGKEWHDTFNIGDSNVKSKTPVVSTDFNLPLDSKIPEEKAAEEKVILGTSKIILEPSSPSDNSDAPSEPKRTDKKGSEKVIQDPSGIMPKTFDFVEDFDMPPRSISIEIDDSESKIIQDQPLEKYNSSKEEKPGYEGWASIFYTPIYWVYVKCSSIEESLSPTQENTIYKDWVIDNSDELQVPTKAPRVPKFELKYPPWSLLLPKVVLLIAFITTFLVVFVVFFQVVKAISKRDDELMKPLIP